MKIVYFDCFSGISGDMVLGALVDAGLNIDDLKSELRKLNLTGYHITSTKTKRNGISATKVSIKVEVSDKVRHLKDIVTIINQSTLSPWVKEKSLLIFNKLAHVEATIHASDINSVHFHEVGAMDAIIDIIGAMIGLEKLGIKKVYASKIHVGSGFIECQHGTIPAPAPATCGLLKNLPIYSNGISSELVTPTGAAIISSIAEQFGNLPEMITHAIGYGAGSKTLNIPNLLRIFIGELDSTEFETEEVYQVETNIDDMNPEFYDHVISSLFEMGCQDVFLIPIQMKKNRPAAMLNVLVQPDKLKSAMDTIFTETSTLGLRIHKVQKKMLKREYTKIETEYGEVTIKIGRMANKITTLAPEYDECQNIALKHKLPIRSIYDKIRYLAIKRFIKDE